LVIVCAYRAWAKEVFHNLELELKSLELPYDLVLVTSQMALLAIVQSLEKGAIVICIGWSEYIPGSILRKHLTIGIHPSDLPNYAGGSPIQHQILDGLEVSKNTLFKFTDDLDNGPIIDKENISLKGGISDVFQELERSSLIMLKKFLQRFPNFELQHQDAVNAPNKRFKPEDSRITPETLQSMSARKLYDFIRCRQDPYPNAFISDSTGTLVFKQVQFTFKN
jgi:methionyl-tRNA formyltransferase